MAPLILHAGYPKCGSTLLQKHLLPAQEGLLLLHDATTINALTLVDHPGGEVARRQVLDALGERVATSAHPVVISCEHLCMPGSWLRTGQRPRGRARLSRPDIIAMLRAHLPPQRVLLIIRDQLRWLPSWYQQRIKGYETLTLARLLDSVDFHDGIVPSLCYDRVVDEYEAAFGPGSVTVLPFEMLVRSPAAFFDGVLSSVGVAAQDRRLPATVQANTGMSLPAVVSHRALNRLLAVVSNGGMLGRRLEPAMIRAMKSLFSLDWIAVRLFGKYGSEAQLPEAVLAHFTASNRSLDARYSLGLNRYGYPWSVPTDVQPAGTRPQPAVG